MSDDARRRRGTRPRYSRTGGAVLLLVLLAVVAGVALASCGDDRALFSGCQRYFDKTKQLNAIWLFDSGEAISMGSIYQLYFDGERWGDLPLPPELRNLRFDGVAGTSTGDIWMSDSVHFDGQTWKTYNQNSPHWARVVDMHAAADGSFVTVGKWSFGQLLASTTTWRWSQPFVEDQFAVWAADAKNVFSVGLDGSRYRYDGKVWTKMATTKGEWLTGVWGASPQDVWAVGFERIGDPSREPTKPGPGVIYHYDGASWRRWPETFKSLWTVSGHKGDVFVGGAQGILRKEGQRFVSYLEATEADEQVLDLHVTANRIAAVSQWEQSKINSVLANTLYYCGY